MDKPENIFAFLKNTFSQKYLSYFKNRVSFSNERVLDLYCSHFDILRRRHKAFRSGWSADFLSDHRFLNWVLYALLVDVENLGNDFTVLDIGCYDGMLVKLLNNSCILAFGYEKHSWNDMYNLLGIKDKIVKRCRHKIDIAIMLNYVHEFHPDKLFRFIEKKCNGFPRLVFFDREERNPHPNMRYYYDDTFLMENNLNIVKFPNCSNVSIESDRDLLVWYNSGE